MSNVAGSAVPFTSEADRPIIMACSVTVGRAFPGDGTPVAVDASNGYLVPPEVTRPKIAVLPGAPEIVEDSR